VKECIFVHFSQSNIELLDSDTCAPAVPGTDTDPLSPRGCQEHEQWRGLTTAVEKIPAIPTGNLSTAAHSAVHYNSYGLLFLQCPIY